PSIDPLFAVLVCFPRIRGDRPPLIGRGKSDPTFPPHTRGSTWCRHARTSPRRVSPAYAGIDLSAQYIASFSSSFPRIRGDRPRSCERYHCTDGFPPHTRGSPLCRAYLSYEKLVSPAYAGIDRQTRSSRS